MAANFVEVVLSTLRQQSIVYLYQRLPSSRPMDDDSDDSMSFPGLSPAEAKERYEEIEKELRNAFTEYRILDVLDVNWKGIKSCLMTLKFYNNEMTLIWKTVYLMLEVFEKNWRYTSVLPYVADVLHFLIVDVLFDLFTVDIQCINMQTRQICIPNICSNLYKREEHNSLYKLMTMPYPKDHKTIMKAEMETVWYTAVNVGTGRLLPILLRYGATYTPQSSHPDEWVFASQVLRDICRCLGRDQAFYQNELMAELEPLTDVEVRRRRIFTVTRAMDVVRRKMSCLIQPILIPKQVSQQNFIDRFRMIFETIPEPIVTLQEVSDILEKTLQPRNMVVKKIFCAWFQRLMPESVAPITPRSLKHLCRCQVRENLRLNGVFPYAVKEMILPQILKKYILLEDWYPADSFQTENEKLSLDDLVNSANPPFDFEINPPFQISGDEESRVRIMERNFQREMQEPR